MGLISNGTTIFDAGSLAAGLGGSMTFIKKLTASTSATLSFVDGASSVVLDNTYNSYLFTFNNIHPSVDGEKCGFQGNAAGGSGYNETITSTFFHAAANEGGTDAGPLEYEAGYDLAQGTTFQRLTHHLAMKKKRLAAAWPTASPSERMAPTAVAACGATTTVIRSPASAVACSPGRCYSS